eukprot:CAMPEP_0194207038 /NCGR_PEP_ID=MMETSP0156-20130528/5910_1 /TAXON_ID=33649 /ORGANISM="Thalassionema nitzschioides, Strain L26-B" /LENGTH=290 /DNA_ID=CAMNT_0038933717 /DNA_START=109 /DNA_END=981 /DNA_ORIENTATION=+
MSRSALVLSTFFVLSQHSIVMAFHALPRALAFRTLVVPNNAQQGPLLMNNESADRKRRRIRRKAPITGETVTNKQKEIEQVDARTGEAEKLPESPSPSPDLSREPESKPPEDFAVEFKIQDVRDVLAGKDSSDVEPIGSKESEEDDDDDEWEYVDIDDEEDNEEYEYAIEDVEEGELDSLQQLLVDAKALREVEKEEEEEEEEEGKLKVPESVRNALSTIVTVDFFVVIALLLWFLAGIFASSILKDDGIQIAFNSNFQQIVQPALGILMIGSAASAVFSDEESEQDRGL